MTMPSYSLPSSDVYFINIPGVKNASAEFVYNFYVQKESVQETSGIPAKYLNQRPDSVMPLERSAQVSFELRTPRYVTLKWTASDAKSFAPEDATKSSRLKNIVLNSENYDKIVSHEKFTSKKFLPYVFSSTKTIEYAYRDINKDGAIDLGKSPESNVNGYIENLLASYSDEDDENAFIKRQEIANAVSSIEKMADRPYETHGIYFYDENGNQIVDTSGFDQVVKKDDVYFKTLVNTLVVPDVFLSASVSSEILDSLKGRYQDVVKRPPIDPEDVPISPVLIGEEVDPFVVTRTTSRIIGYVIEKYKLTPSGFVKVGGPILINNIATTSITDLRILYGTTYCYSIRTVAAVSSYGFDDEDNTSREIVYLISSSPVIARVECIENVPPPAPEMIDFLWDYKNKKLNIIWQPPMNTQRDIKQYQVFRRKNINEPFELLCQKTFDFSAVKYRSGEVIDGNRDDMTPSEKEFVKYYKEPNCSYIDDEFVVDIDMLKTSEYIYTVCAIDAHGIVSNYGPQFELKFDFFKNILVKRIISSSGAPRQYPNMKIDADLFKDVIKTEGQASKKLKIYFMPEYFNIRTGVGPDGLKRVVATKQNGEYYRLQFINLQNQKSDSIKITIDDEENLVNFASMPQAFVRDV